MVKKILFTFVLVMVALPAFAQQDAVVPVRVERREAAKEKVAAVRVEVKERLAKVRDDKKSAALLRVERELARLNARITEQLTKSLDQIDRVLARVTERINKAKEAGRDVSSLLLKVDAAKSAIASTRTALTAQTAKKYTVVVDAEDALRQNVQAAREMLRSDLKKVRDSVQAARAAVRDAAVAFAQIPKPVEQP